MSFANQVEIDMASSKWELLASTLEDNRASSSALRDVVSASQQFSAWGVGIATPGMLGILANVTKLRDISRLGPIIFSVLFSVGEVLFIVAIMAAVVYHRYCSRAVMLIAASSGNVVVQTGLWREPLSEGREKLNEREQTIAADFQRQQTVLESELKEVLKLSKPFVLYEYSVLLVAYIIVAIIFGTSWP
ncbi:MAG TPA: hypothetical protein VLB76_04980 [Thermoanaerobaculia bacterium]|nr:hypothetical protein [Thermoanaerobaculia bacterium]